MKPRKQKEKVATAYYWPTIYAIVKASSDQAVARTLKRFGM